ncbi:MAG: hypothetical protein N3A69_17100, partial [Leptospiraceae bacterium]|nr:hypothetical protein [Leptospiraceae bacterium]
MGFDKKNEIISSTGFHYLQSYEDDFTSNLDFDFYLEDVDSLNHALDISNFEIGSKRQESQEELLDEIIDSSKLEEESLLSTSPNFSSLEEESFESTDELETEPLTEDYLDEILQKPLEIEQEDFQEEHLEQLSSSDFSNSFEEELDYDFEDPDTTLEPEFARELEENEDTNITLSENELENILNADYSNLEIKDEVAVPNTPDELIFHEEVSQEESIQVDVQKELEAPILFDEESKKEIEDVQNEEITLEQEEIPAFEEEIEEEFEEEEYGKSFFDSDEEIEEDFQIEEEDYDKEELQEETFGDATSFFDSPTSIESESVLFSEGLDEDESITLSPDELGNITSDEEIEV